MKAPERAFRSAWQPALPSYLLITPVRDEAAHIGATVASVLAQHHRPQRWVIVDDGSTDATPQLLRDSTRGHPWISVLRRHSAARALGSAEVLAFQHGLAHVAGEPPCDFIVKLDADLRLPADYFERLLAYMAERPHWGIASGVYCEWRHGQWVDIPMPAYHAAGASKVVRRACFEQIGGFVPRKGWDTVDEIRASLRGWTTGHLPELRFQHLKPEGAAMGGLATQRFHGEICHQTGAGLGFVLAKALHRMVSGWPPVVGGLALLWGYLWPLLTRQPRLVTPEEAQHYRRMLAARLARPWTLLRGRRRHGLKG